MNKPINLTIALAEWLENPGATDYLINYKAAAELRRLHTENEALRAAPSTSLAEAQVTAAIGKWFSKEFEYNSSMETRMRAAISAALAIKGGA